MINIIGVDTKVRLRNDVMFNFMEMIQNGTADVDNYGTKVCHQIMNTMLDSYRDLEMEAYPSGRKTIESLEEYVNAHLEHSVFLKMKILYDTVRSYCKDHQLTVDDDKLQQWIRNNSNSVNICNNYIQGNVQIIVDECKAAEQEEQNVPDTKLIDFNIDEFNKLSSQIQNKFQEFEKKGAANISVDEYKVIINEIFRMAGSALESVCSKVSGSEFIKSDNVDKAISELINSFGLDKNISSQIAKICLQCLSVLDVDRKLTKDDFVKYFYNVLNEVLPLFGFGNLDNAILVIKNRSIQAASGDVNSQTSQTTQVITNQQQPQTQEAITFGNALFPIKVISADEDGNYEVSLENGIRGTINSVEIIKQGKADMIAEDTMKRVVSEWQNMKKTLMHTDKSLQRLVEGFDTNLGILDITPVNERVYDICIKTKEGTTVVVTFDKGSIITNNNKVIYRCGETKDTMKNYFISAVDERDVLSKIARNEYTKEYLEKITLINENEELLSRKINFMKISPKYLRGISKKLLSSSSVADVIAKQQELLKCSAKDADNFIIENSKVSITSESGKDLVVVDKSTAA